MSQFEKMALETDRKMHKQADGTEFIGPISRVGGPINL